VEETQRPPVLKAAHGVCVRTRALNWKYNNLVPIKRNLLFTAIQDIEETHHTNKEWLLHRLHQTLQVVFNVIHHNVDLVNVRTDNDLLQMRRISGDFM